MTDLYELWGWARLGAFSDDMYNNDLYWSVGITMFISTFVWMILYYYLIDHPRFSRFWHWGLWVIAIAAINFGIAYYWSTSGLDAVYVLADGDIAPYYNEFYTFSFIAAGIALVVAIAWSVIVKWKSKNCSRTPF